MSPSYGLTLFRGRTWRVCFTGKGENVRIEIPCSDPIHDPIQQSLIKAQIVNCRTALSKPDAERDGCDNAHIGGGSVCASSRNQNLGRDWSVNVVMCPGEHKSYVTSPDVIRRSP